MLVGTKRWIVSVLSLAAACGQQPDATNGRGSSAVVDPAGQARQMKATALANAADRALADSVRLDFRRPEIGGMPKRDNVRRAYWDACVAGDHRSCWLAPVIRDQGNAREQVVPKIEPLLRDACQAGDMMSCRAIPDGPWIARHRAGAAAASGSAGSDSGAPCPAGDACPMADFRKECELGFPESCRKAAYSQPDPPDAQPLVAVAVRLERDGCRAGLIDECEGLYSSAAIVMTHAEVGVDDDVDLVEIKADYALAGEMLCTLALDGCETLSLAYELTDPARSRDATERACQFQTSAKDRLDPCRTLVSHYTTKAKLVGLWPEPVPGRAAALRAWLDKQGGDKDQ